MSIVHTARQFIAAGVLVGVLMALGCSSGDESPIRLVPVSGSIIYGGQPLTKGTITFMPVTGTNTATGEITAGQYSLSTFRKDDGVPPGDYKIAITAWEQEPGMGTEGVPAIPKRYFNPEKSGLTATVQEDHAAPIDFALEEK